MSTPPMQTPSLGARAAIARRLESPLRPPLATRLLASVWSLASVRALARPLELPPGASVIGVGGATLGGSCKTPFSIALAEALAARGIRVALVGHAYRADPRRARVVDPGDRVAEVGDDALFAARRLDAAHIDVVVGPSRQAATTLAARRASWLIVDGLLQARPVRIARSLLLLDGARPWHDGHCPPAGDYRAPLSALLAAADAAIVVRDELDTQPSGDGAPPDALYRLDRAITPAAEAVPLVDLVGVRTGLVVTVARPHRIVAALERRGIRPVELLAFPDHHRPSPSELDRATAGPTRRIDAWLTTGKCATKLPAVLAGAPVLVLDHALRLSDRLVDWVLALSSSKEGRALVDCAPCETPPGK
jgi:tetraacyldisaccharide 4'-kinase